MLAILRYGSVQAFTQQRDRPRYVRRPDRAEADDDAGPGFAELVAQPQSRKAELPSGRSGRQFVVVRCARGEQREVQPGLGGEWGEPGPGMPGQCRPHDTVPLGIEPAGTTEMPSEVSLVDEGRQRGRDER